MSVINDVLPNGIGSLQSLQVLQSIGNPDYPLNKQDLIGLIGGGLAGWLASKKYPMIPVYVGIIVGAEIGILIARMFVTPTQILSNGLAKGGV